MKKIFALSLILAAALVAAAYAERYTPATSTLTIKGTSTLHDWQVESNTINGTIDWNNGSAVVHVGIPVESIKADHDRMTRIMRDALKASQNPQITYDLTSARMEPNDADAFVVNTDGKLTIAGVTRDVQMKIEGKRLTPTTVALTGTAPIRMTDYGIKPPVTMMNTLKTGNDVTVSFRWVVQTAR